MSDFQNLNGDRYYNVRQPLALKAAEKDGRPPKSLSLWVLM